MTLAQLRLFLREGEYLARLDLVQQARAMQAANSDKDGFDSYRDGMLE